MKIYSVSITNNPIVGNINLDFTDGNGNPLDTVIFAGENGCGKSTILECLTILNSSGSLAEGESRRFVLEIDSAVCKKLNDRYQSSHRTTEYINVAMADYTIFMENGNLRNNVVYFSDYAMQNRCEMPAYYIENPVIFLSPEINFTPQSISSITAKNTDEYRGGLNKTTPSIATEITQLIVDIDSLDNSDFSKLYAQHKRNDYSQHQLKPRISRFNDAFTKIFDNLYIEEIENVHGQKIVYFRNRGKRVRIENLSSGEKQIVFRGGYLLKDKNSLSEAIVIIDEPELSLHPDWQKKILDFYKSIFTNEKGEQTSQLFVATHSPYVIHSENRKNDKVIVLQKNAQGEITVMDKPEYYGKGDVTVVADAFNIHEFHSENVPTVYLEGRTDEKYFNKALEVFNIHSKFKYKWVGFLDDNNQEKNTGKDALNNAYNFLVARNDPHLFVCLFDCDANKQIERKNNVISLSIEKFDVKKDMNKGIENALILDNIDLSEFYIETIKNGDYGKKTIIYDLDKMKLCEYICCQNVSSCRKILANLKKVILKIEQFSV